MDFKYTEPNMKCTTEKNVYQYFVGNSAFAVSCLYDSTFTVISFFLYFFPASRVSYKTDMYFGNILKRNFA